MQLRVAETMMTFQPVLFTLLLLATTALAQDDECPNEATDCSDPCEEAQCARFLNAECRENPCFSLCSPNFFWRSKNVTDRCDIERCSDKECPGLRECVEETVPASCPEDIPLCRQHIRVRCVLPPPPTDCSQITCGLGMFCRERVRGKGVKCVRARKCSQLECTKGFTCTETEEEPLCTKLPSSCEEAACPEELVCSLSSIPARDLSIAQCISQAEADRMPVYSPDFSCASVICDKKEPVCSDVFEDGRFLFAFCNVVDCDQSDSESCSSSSTCTNIPPELLESLQVPYTTACTQATGFAYGGNCTTMNPCPPLPGLACHDVLVDGIEFGVACGFTAETYTGFRCSELDCPPPLVCHETIIEGRGSLAQCVLED